MVRRRLAYEPPVAVDRETNARTLDGLETFDPRPEGTIFAITGREEPPEQLRRLLMQCYHDLMPVNEAMAHHTTKRLHEQLTGRMDAAAAMRIALSFRYVSPEPHNKVLVAEDADLLAMVRVVE